MSDAATIGGLVTGGAGLALALFTTIRQARVQSRVTHLENVPRLLVSYGNEDGGEYLQITNDGPLDLTDVFVELHGGAGWQAAIFHVAANDPEATPDASHLGDIPIGTPRRAYIDRYDGNGLLHLRITCRAAKSHLWTLPGTVVIPPQISRAEIDQNLLLKELSKAAAAESETDLSTGLGGEVFFYNEMGEAQFIHHPGFPDGAHPVRSVADMRVLLDRGWISMQDHGDSGGYTFAVTPTGFEAARHR
jgi:hypothetical protein